jgi:iron complex outermembrane receptor protein
VCAVLTGWLFAAEAARAEAAPPPPAVPAADASPAAEETVAADKPKGPAAETAPELLLWQEIPTVVSASRREEPASRAPNAVSIITAQEIHESGMTTLGDLLRMAVGVDVGQINNADFAIGVRGLHGKWANSTLVLMDGRTIYNPVWGGTSSATQPVMLEDIERIEVVRGPGGAAWGANAANGVINIITKKPGATPGFFLSQTLTNRVDSLTHMRYGLTAGKLDLRLSASYDHSPEIRAGDHGANHDFYRLPAVNLRSTYHFSEENSLDVDAGYVDGVIGSTPESVTVAGQDYRDSRWFPQSHFVRTRFTHEKAPDDLWYVQYFMNSARLSLSEQGPWLAYSQHDVEAQRVQPLGRAHTLTYGGNVRVDLLDNGDPPNTGAGVHGTRFDNEPTGNYQTGLFVQDRMALSEQWTLVGGVRADRNSYTGWEWSGRGTVLFHPVKEHVFRGSVARGFRTPTLVDRRVNLREFPTGLPAPFPAFGLLVNGNEDLNASYVNAYEFGYTYERKRTRLNFEFFFNDYRGIMAAAQQSLPGAIPVRTVYQNAIDGHLYGWELSGQWRVARTVRLDASYVWEQWVQREEPRTFDVPYLWATDLAIPPQQKVGLGARWEPLKGLTVAGRMWWVSGVTLFGPVEIPPYARFDFSVAKKLGDHFEVAAGVLNAFDPHHQEMGTAPGVPLEVGERTWFVRLQANF